MKENIKLIIGVCLSTIIIFSILTVFLFIFQNKIINNKPLSFKKTPAAFTLISGVNANDITASLDKTNNGTLVEIKKDNNSLIFSQPIINPIIKKIDNKIIYQSSSGNEEIHYQVNDNGIKEEIIFKSPDNIKYTFSYQLELNNLTLARNIENTYTFFDKTTNKPIFNIPKPFMTDANNDKSYQINMHYRIKDGKDYLEFILDKNWLTDPKRKFPIIIDPSVVIPSGSTSYELVGKRNQISKTFLNSNNYFTSVIHNKAIHYQDNSGAWQEIDNAIMSSSDPNYDFMNVTNNFKTYFKKNITNNVNNVKFQVKDAWISFNSLDNLRTKPAVTIIGEPNKIRYQKNTSVNKDSVTVDYTISNNSLLEEIIVDSPNNIPIVSQSLHIENAYPQITNKQINFYHKITNKLLWSFPEPVMYEFNSRVDPKTNQSSQFRNYGLHYQLKCLDANLLVQQCSNETIKQFSNFILTKIIDPEGNTWLADKSRVYPIVIDATANLNNPTEDGYIEQDNMGVWTRYNSGDQLYFGYFDNGGPWTYRSYVEWDVSSITDGSTISDVSFKYSGDAGSYDPGDSIYSMLYQPSVTSDDQVHSDAADGTAYLNSNKTFPETGDNKEVGTGGNVPWSDVTTLKSDLASALSNNWFALGFYADESIDQTSLANMTRVASEENTGTAPDPTLYVTYTDAATPTPTPTPIPTPVPESLINIEGVNLNGVNIN